MKKKGVRVGGGRDQESGSNKREGGRDQLSVVLFVSEGEKQLGEGWASTGFPEDWEGSRLHVLLLELVSGKEEDTTVLSLSRSASGSTPLPIVCLK